VLRRKAGLVDDGLDDILYVFLFEECDLVGGRLGVAAALDELDVLQIVNLGNDHVLLEVRNPYLRRFRQLPLHQ